ncbi:MAG TPA: hypothetical protein VMU24_11950 [Candidatus Acidoferrales bacterium]|nr:hypothetical protein [Candidatus Acidoferrales bacterium]
MTQEAILLVACEAACCSLPRPFAQVLLGGTVSRVRTADEALDFLSKALSAESQSLPSLVIVCSSADSEAISTVLSYMSGQRLFEQTPLVVLSRTQRSAERLFDFGANARMVNIGDTVALLDIVSLHCANKEQRIPRAASLGPDRPLRT